MRVYCLTDGHAPARETCQNEQAGGRSLSSTSLAPLLYIPSRTPVAFDEGGLKAQNWLSQILRHRATNTTI